ncbi:MAG: Serine/threonine-protein kinase pkn3, partial [Labilithrix sp.]|nr:Serine/threonine-protein kinase pkn3 [Labilithrix sp.]
MNVTPPGAPRTGRVFVMPQPGDLVAGKYAVVRVLGEGGMGIVYEATHQRLRQRVALKMLLPSMLEHEVIVSRFEREARAAAQLRGRHCAKVKDVDVTSDGLPYMVMDFLEGHDLQVEIERRGRLPIGEAVDYVLQACAAMVEAHQLGIIHRDLKPSNLFLELDPDSGGESWIVKVLDFGISKVAANEGDAKLTEVDAIMGTALYMSPEQVKASHSVDARSDIWALGVILY